MSRCTRFELLEDPSCYTPSSSVKETSIFTARTKPFPSFLKEDLDVQFAFDLFNPCQLSSQFVAFDAVSDLVTAHRMPSFVCKRVQRVERLLGSEFCLESLSDRVAELESQLDRLVCTASCSGGDRKCTWKSETKGSDKFGSDKNYRWVTEFKEEKKTMNEKEKRGIAKNFKWTAEIKEKGEDTGSSRKYTYEVKSGDAEKNGRNKKDKKKRSELRIVEIEEPSGNKNVIRKQRYGAVQSNRGKRKELSPQDAALLIQRSFRAYLIRRSKVLRALRGLAVAKSRLKEIRVLFNNFAYQHRIARDAEERQKFAEKIIVLLLTVDSIEGADFFVRSTKRSMVDELEAMLDVVDPQPGEKKINLR
ncbi:BAG family molecular chaperone regulator 7-like [Neltuma alba]|uniref:BAG family molecular chaperone regulator 7-like n=1 Tax=Neltuma alba TaxID=207710 RepID=UPI0010A2B91B|nr:BAG family molecular chaperone regulator 7-like [Prosopis alba]